MGNWWEEQPKPTGSLASLQPTVQPLSVPSAPAALPAFDSAAANNPYAAQLAQGLQAYRNRPSRFSTEPASLPAPAQPPEADKPAFDLGNSLSALYEGATEQFIPGVKSALAQAYTGLERPDRNPEWATRFMEEGRQAQQQADQRTAELQRQGQSDSTSEAIRSAIPSLGFSLGSMAAAIPAGLAGAAATQAAIPIPGSGLVGGALAAGAASGVAGYRMAGSQFLNDTFAQMEQESQKQRGRGLTEQEKATAYQELRPVAENTGLWEAVPEAIGNAAMLGLGRVALGLMPKAAMQNLAASALGRAGVRTGAAAGALATEVGTEGVTQFAQGNDQQKGQAAVDALLSGKDMKTAMAAVDPQYQGFQGLVQSTKDVAPATIATVLLMGGLAKPGHMAYSAIRDRREGNARVEDATQATADLRANLEFAREDDITTALTGFDQIETSGTLPKAAAKRLDAARQQLIEELSLRAAPDALNEPLDTRRGQAGYLGFADRANELNDDQVFEAAQRPLPQDAPAELQDARARYGQEAKRRQDLNLAAAHFDQNPEAVAGVAKVLADIGGGKPLNKGGHGSVDYNLSSLSDDMLARYRMAGTVLLRDHAETLGNRAEKLNQTLALLSEETERRASGQRRDPQAIREADIAQKIAKGEKNAKKLLTGLSPDAMERMASGLESRSQLEPGLADTAREIRALANKERARLFNSQGAKQPGIQSALRGWNQNQPNMPAPQGQPLDQQIAADRARLSELAQQQVERQRQEKLADRTQAIQQQEADRRARLNAEIATRGAPGELARLLGPDTQLPSPRQSAPAPQSLSDLLNRPSQSAAVPIARAGERGSLSDLFPQNRNWWDTELSPSKVTTETPAPPKSGWARFGNETGTLNIPRAEMPQVKAEHRGALVNFLNARGVAHEQDEEVDPTTLKPTQAEFSPKKVQQANEYQGGNRSILVSSDGHVVDGHHQWLSALSKGTPIKAIRLDAPIADLLPLVKEFPSSTESKATTQPQPEQRREERQAEAAPLLSQEAGQKSNAKKPKAKGVAPTWNSASEIERAAMISRSSEKAGAPVSNTFAQRKAAEWKTWADIPDGPAKQRLRDYMKSVEQISIPATMDGGKAAPEKTKNPYATSKERDEAISRLENAARNSEYRAIRENADLIGDAARMGATEAEMMAAIEAGDGKALERIADRQHEKTGGLLLGFGNGKLSQSFGYKKVERHPAHDYKNWENLTDAQVNAFSKAASIKPGKTRQETLDRIDSRKTPAEWAEAWDKAFPENRNRLTDIGKAETAPNRTEYQGKDTDKKADIKSSKQSPPPASQGAARNRAINATVDAGKDSILTAIAKIGGLDRAEAQRQGIDPAEFQRMPVFGKPVFRKNSGKSFDAMAESLSEFGYPVLDEKRNYSPNVLLDAISRELAGNPVYTPQGIESAARRDAEEQAKFEQDNWLLDAVDLEHTGFDALNDQEQVTAQLQAEASRDLGEDAADTIFERISQQHEQATPDQFNEALRAAFNEARQRQSANSREQAGEPGSVQATDAILQDYSTEELRAEEERVAKAQADQEAKDKAAQQKTAADRARSDFVLTGSNRLADVAMARGQTNLLGAMEERPKTRFSRAALSPIAKEAISYFGTTSNLEEAGYVLPDGTLLDFSGRAEASKNDYRRDGNRWIWTGKGRDYLSNQRSMDHREVSKLPSINKSSTDAMLEFQRDAKALRIDMMSGRVSANFSDWSPAQMRAAMAIARNNYGSLTIDFDHPVTNRLIRSIDLDRASQAKINALLLEETNKDRRFSRNEISSSLSNSITKARAQLVAALNERSVAALERSGKLILHREDPTRTGAAGYVDPQGAIHLIPSNMDQDALSVALHEAMHLARDDRFSEGNRAHIRLAHAALKITGLKNFIGNPGFSNLVQQLHRLAAEGNKTAIEALDKARREAPGNVEDEALAYLVQYADENLPLVRRIIAAIRAALYRMGIKVKLTPADVRALALSALKARAKDAALVQTARTQESFSLPEFAPTEADKAEVERQIKAVKEVRDGQGRLLAPNGKPSNLNERQWKQVRTKFFNDWFGDWENDPKNASKVVDGNGEPLVMLHGSSENFDTFKKTKGWVSTIFGDEEVERTGFFFTDDLEFASSFGPTIDIYLNIRNPFDMRNGISEDMYQKAEEAGISGRWLLKSMDDWERFDEEDGRIFVENLQNAKYDGSAFIEDDGNGNNVNVFVAFSSGQIKSATRNAGTFSPRSNRIDYSQPTTETDAAEQDRLWQEFQAVRAQFQAKQASQSAFDRWFGKGVEGVNARNEKPLVLYHGTNNPEFNRWDESLSGQASRHPTAGLGFFMTADARSAARYGSRLLELNAKINKPYFMTDADLTSIEDTQDAARFRRKLQAQGYDAAVIVAPGAAPYVVAFQSSQVKLTSNTNPTESEDFRYSRPGRPPNLNSPRVAARVMDDIGGVMNDLKPGEKPLAKANPRNFAQMLTDLKANTRPQWLGLLTRNMQLELAREVLPRPMVDQFERAAEAMDAAESKMIQREAFPLADRWQALIRKHREQADRLARSLYMATWTGTDPRQPMPTKKRAEWIRTKAAYDGLTDPEAKKLFSEVLGFYQGQTERLFKELQNRIDRHSLPAADKLAAKDMLRQEFERMKDDGPYVPLMRFGDLTVFAEARTAGEKPVFATFETVQDQRAFADWLKKEGYQPQLGVKTEEVAKRALPQGDFVGKLAGIIDKTTQGPEGQVLKDAMYQLFLRSLPEQAIRKHFIHRRFVPGYTADALRTFATFGRRSAKQIARLAHSDRMSDALEAMAKANREGQTQEPVSAGHLINELEKSFQWAMNPGTNALSSRLTHLGFLWHLGASPAHLLLNLSQQAQVTFPWLAGEMHGKIGSGSVAAALAKANKDFIASNPFTSADKRGAAAKKRRSDLEGEFNGDMGRALKALEESGKTDKTQTYSLSGLSEEDSWLWSKPYLRKFTEGAAWFFHVAEVINREASAIAAYRLARRAGMSHEQGYDLARRAINETHFDYSPGNRARFMRGNVAKVLTLFKQYSLNISWQLGRNAYLWARGGSKAEKAQARTKLLGMLGMTMVMAGAAGMPFYGEIMWMLTQLLNATRDDDEPEWDADTEFRSLLDRAFGATGDEAVRHGLINAFMGIDVSSRIKLDDLWWRPIGDDADGKNMAYQMMEQALGPVAGLFVRGVATADGLMESLVAGDNARGASWRAIEGSLPKALKDISRSIRYAKEGATTFQGATLLPADRISALAKLGQAIGFVPAELAERYDENRAMKSLERRILTRRRALLDTVAMGLLSQDDEVVRAASEDIAAFNRRYPTVAITGDTISKSLRGRLRAKIETEAAGGVRLDKRLAGMLLEGIR